MLLLLSLLLIKNQVTHTVCRLVNNLTLIRGRGQNTLSHRYVLFSGWWDYLWEYFISAPLSALCMSPAGIKTLREWGETHHRTERLQEERDLLFVLQIFLCSETSRQLFFADPYSQQTTSQVRPSTHTQIHTQKRLSVKFEGCFTLFAAAAKGLGYFLKGSNCFQVCGLSGSL